jgi:hypothetical protein
MKFIATKIVYFFLYDYDFIYRKDSSGGIIPLIIDNPS